MCWWKPRRGRRKQQPQQQQQQQPQSPQQPSPQRGGGAGVGGAELFEDDDFVPPPRPHLGDLELSPDVYALTGAELRRVRDFTIRRPNVGEVTFPGELDLVRERRVLDELPTIVRLEQGEAVIYPDHAMKPAEGEGLNRPALITLFQCKPPPGSLTDADSKARYRDRIARMTEVKGATFVDYDCDNGIWRFRVSHF